MKEFRVVDEDMNVYGEFDGIVAACRESNKVSGTSVYVMDLKTKTIKEILSDKTVEYFANYELSHVR
ncbi:hypothetical protein [Konateibacter massiliensis]|uniref:hypothetical protein n=1 Tax=Konateibacter massiliensis TaxID=2002841 RepID=UPI000C160B3B|nr:hypothetical protein [Konateibacter massiliensis]